MSASTTTRFGTLLREFREQAELSQDSLAFLLKEDVSHITAIEAGRSEPPTDPEFYLQLQAILGLSEPAIMRLQSAVRDYFAEELEKLIDPLEAQDPHLRFPNVAAGKYGKIPSRTAVTKVKSGEHRTQYTPGPEKQVDPSAVQGTNTPESGLQQPDTETEQGHQAPKKGDIFKRPRSHYDSDYLRENAGHITSILGDALENDDPALSPEHKQALHVVVESIVKKRGASLNKVSREKHIPHPSLADWVRKGLVPVLYRDKRTIYLANEIAEEVSHDYQDAKEMNYSAARLLRERREKYFPVEAAQSRT
jgi:transcriptional regulator with XRE-family HTH domain